MNSGFGIRIGLNLSETHLKDAKEGFSEDIHAHFACPQFPINEGNGNFFDAKSKLSCIVFHFDLKCISDELNPAEVDSLEHFTAVTFETGRAVSYAQPKNGVDIDGSEIAHENAADRPVAYFSSSGVSRPYSNSSAVHACLSKTNQVVWVVRKVTIHFVNQVVSAFQCPMKSSDVSRAQSQFA